ncbi:MAG: IS4/Tn5 family transposase DNA-binding protein, partial [Pseudohongiellaceae bacterium]
MNINEWAKAEFEDINLGDKRLSNRLVKIADQFIGSPESPINKVCSKWSDAKAAYRFFQNERIDYKDIIDHHASKINQRSSNENIILAIQDTT